MDSQVRCEGCGELIDWDSARRIHGDDFCLLCYFDELDEMGED